MPNHPEDVRFSNRPFEVKRFQTIRHCSVDVARGLLLLFGTSMGFEDEVEQSNWRSFRQSIGRSKRTYELTSSIVPRGTSFHCSVELEYPPIAFDPDGSHAAVTSRVHRAPQVSGRCSGAACAWLFSNRLNSPSPSMSFPILWTCTIAWGPVPKAKRSSI